MNGGTSSAAPLAVTNTAQSPAGVALASFDNSSFRRGRPALVEGLWILIQAVFVSSFLPGSAHRRLLLRLFGARIGKRVTIKPGVRVKFPWRLTVADDVWIGEYTWIDNLADVQIGANVCISQGAYLCTGSHDWGSSSFDLIARPIKIGQSAWIAAKACIGPGVSVGEGAVLTLGSTAHCDLEPWSIYMGGPAKRIKERRLNGQSAL